MPADVTAVGSANAAQSGSSMSPGCVRDSATTVTCTAPAEAAGATTTSTSAGLEAQLGLVYERAAAAGRPVAGLRAGDGAGTTSSWNVPFTVSPSAPEHTTLTGGTAILHQPADANPANNEADWTVLTTGAQAALTVTKHASVMTVRAGQQFSYLITVTNRGPSTARNVVVADPLPSALVFVSSPQRCKASGRTVICPNVAVLSPSVSKSFTVVVRVSSSYRGNGSVVNTATARSDAGNSRGSGSATVRASSGSRPEPVRTGGPEPIRSGGAWTGVLPITGFDLRVAEVAMILLLSGGILLITVRRRRRIERGTSR
jgi:uncharacterized repeat protein (TIGR01451 family)